MKPLCMEEIIEHLHPGNHPPEGPIASLLVPTFTNWRQFYCIMHSEEIMKKEREKKIKKDIYAHHV